MGGEGADPGSVGETGPGRSLDGPEGELPGRFEGLSAAAGQGTRRALDTDNGLGDASALTGGRGDTGAPP